MDAARLEQLKQDLLNGEVFKHRRLIAITGLFLLAFCAITLAGGYFLVTHAMDDNEVSTRAVNTPSQVSLLFEGQHPYQLINNIVFLNRVKLAPATEKANDKAKDKDNDKGNLYYAGDESQKLLVAFHGNKGPEAESVANVMGTLRPVSSAMLKRWKLTKDEQKTVKAQGVYLEAESIRVKKAATTVAEK